MATTRKPPSKLAQVAKYPAAYVLLVVVGLIGFFAHSFLGESQGRTGDCKEQLLLTQQREAHKDSVIEAMAWQLRVQQSTYQQLPAVADSLLRRK